MNVILEISSFNNAILSIIEQYIKDVFMLPLQPAYIQFIDKCVCTVIHTMYPHHNINDMVTYESIQLYNTAINYKYRCDILQINTMLYEVIQTPDYWDVASRLNRLLDRFGGICMIEDIKVDIANKIIILELHNEY